MDVYLISGLGADRTVFRNLTFSKGNNVHYLDWITPKPNESLRSYALRLAEGINTSRTFCIIGLSFGGMLATEIASVLKPQSTILISSISSKFELPWHYRLAGRIRINKLIPAKKLNSVPRFISSFFGVETKDESLFFNQLMRRTDPHFSKWAIDSMLKWNRTESPPGIVRIHGGKDKVLPIKDAKVDYLIQDGGHFMVFNRAKRISEILKEAGVC
ncbi:MAG TPA: alpha/beta hydrolase [Puia sp.]|nr:alpha/beta hydrolase [Puia sp.]